MFLFPEESEKKTIWKTLFEKKNAIYKPLSRKKENIKSVKSFLEKNKKLLRNCENFKIKIKVNKLAMKNAKKQLGKFANLMK